MEDGSCSNGDNLLFVHLSDSAVSESFPITPDISQFTVMQGVTDLGVDAVVINDDDHTIIVVEVENPVASSPDVTVQYVRSTGGIVNATDTELSDGTITLAIV